MKHHIFILSVIIFTSACAKRSPKINHEINIDSIATIDDRILDTTKTIVASLPIKFDSTVVLIYTVELVSLDKQGTYRHNRSGSYSDSDIGASFFNSDNLYGSFINLIFEDDSGKRLLTKNKVNIKNGYFLRQIYKLSNNGYILYMVYDIDTNGDGRLNNEDIEALYISNINGTNFTKLTKELHEFYDYRILKNESSIYFRTLEDINQDGVLNNNDKFHYYYMEFIEDQYTVVEYNPLDIFN